MPSGILFNKFAHFPVGSRSRDQVFLSRFPIVPRGTVGFKTFVVTMVRGRSSSFFPSILAMINSRSRIEVLRSSVKVVDVAALLEFVHPFQLPGLRSAWFSNFSSTDLRIYGLGYVSTWRVRPAISFRALSSIVHTNLSNEPSDSSSREYRPPAPLNNRDRFLSRCRPR